MTILNERGWVIYDIRFNKIRAVVRIPLMHIEIYNLHDIQLYHERVAQGDDMFGKVLLVIMNGKVDGGTSLLRE